MQSPVGIMAAMKKRIDATFADGFPPGPPVAAGGPVPRPEKPGHHCRVLSRCPRTGFLPVLALPFAASEVAAAPFSAAEIVLSGGNPDLLLLIVAMMGAIALRWRP